MINYEKIKEEHAKLAQELSSQDVYSNRDRYQTLAKRFSFLEKIVSLIKKQEKARTEISHLTHILNDSAEESDVKALAESELPKIENDITECARQIEELFFAQNEEEERDVIIEIRAAAGGDEAALFAADLFKMYSKYIEKNKWKLEVLGSHPTEMKGFKEIVFSVRGKGSFRHLKFESGVHRVQRVPTTESGGRIHTSTATVAVLVEPKSVEVKIDPGDLRIDTFRASGHGGQHVNKTDSAVRITHLPTGIVVGCQAERSQIKNREKAMRVLKAKLLDKMQHEEQSKITNERRVQIGTGERSEKIRTYNFPERRVTEHRIGLTLYKLEAILEGDIDDIIEGLLREEKQKLYEAKGMGPAQ